MISRPTYLPHLGIVVAALLAMPTTTQASGHGAAKKSAHGSAKGHGAANGHGAVSKGHGHGESKGHGAAKADSHGEKSDDSEGHSSAPDYEELLSMISLKDKKHDPRLYVEVDLGEFKVTHSGPEKSDYLVVLRFQIFGVLHEQELAKIQKSLEERQQRMRDTVLSVVQKTHFDQLNDPSLDAVKSDLVVSINRVLETNILRDIAFSKFSMEPD
jgi:hypothetical protein